MWRLWIQIEYSWLLERDIYVAKKKIRKLNKPYYVADDWGHTDARLVEKINELIDIINYQQGIIKDFEMALKGKRR